MKTARGGTASPLEAHLGYWLRFVSNQVSHSFDRKLAAHECQRRRMGGAARVV